MIKELGNKLFFLDKFKIGQGLRRLFNSLVQSVLKPVADINNVDHFALQPRVEHVSFVQIVLEIRTSGQHQTLNVAAIVSNETLNRHLADLTQVVVSFFLPQTSKTD